VVAVQSNSIGVVTKNPSGDRQAKRWRRSTDSKASESSAARSNILLVRVMEEALRSASAELQRQISARGLADQVTVELAGEHLRILLRAENRVVWVGHRVGSGYFLVTGPDDEPTAFFTFDSVVIATLLPLRAWPSHATLADQPRPEDSSERAKTSTNERVLFVSYSRTDETLIRPLVDLLRLSATEVFRDRDGIGFGEDWRLAIESAVNRCTDFLVFWCTHSAHSPEVTNEYTLALRLNKRIVPVLLDNSTLTLPLERLQAIDMRQFGPHGSPAPAPNQMTRVEQSVLTVKQHAAASYLTDQLSDLLKIPVEPLLMLPSNLRMPAKDTTNAVNPDPIVAGGSDAASDRDAEVVGVRRIIRLSTLADFVVPLDFMGTRAQSLMYLWMAIGWGSLWLTDAMPWPRQLKALSVFAILCTTWVILVRLTRRE
jgi:hypothetical protein